MLLQGAGVIVSVETVHGRFQFINAPEEEPTMVARLPQQVLLLLVLGEWDTISIYIPLRIFRLVVVVVFSFPSSEPLEKYRSGRSFARGQRAATCLIAGGGGGGGGADWWFFADPTNGPRIGSRNHRSIASKRIAISIAKTRCIMSLIIGLERDEKFYFF